MRILLCLNRDLMSNLALNLLRPALAPHDFDIVLSDGIGGKPSFKAREIERWQEQERALMEDALFPHLEERKSVAGQFGSFCQLAEMSRSGAVREFPSINESDGLAYVQEFRPDVIVSIRFGQIFKPPVIAVPRFGIVNLHSGLLPHYRGVLATFWAMLMRETEIGCTLHDVTDGTIDTGAILGIHRMPVNRQRSLQWNVASLYPGGVAMLANTLDALGNGHTIATTAQSGGRYFSYPQSHDVATFLSQGHTLCSGEDYLAILKWYGVRDTDAQALLSNVFPE
jgi:methionyl-tRNA formyltransferase